MLTNWPLSIDMTVKIAFHTLGQPLLRRNIWHEEPPAMFISCSLWQVNNTKLATTEKCFYKQVPYITNSRHIIGFIDQVSHTVPKREHYQYFITKDLSSSISFSISASLLIIWQFLNVQRLNSIKPIERSKSDQTDEHVLCYLQRK